MGAPEQVTNLTAATSQYPGEVLLSWKSVHGAKSYAIEKSLGGTTDWKACGTSTRSRTAIDGLASMTNVWFRITAIGSAGESPVSAIVKALVA